MKNGNFPTRKRKEKEENIGYEGLLRCVFGRQPEEGPLPKITDVMKSRISRVLYTGLLPREVFILNERFGIGTGIPRTLKQVGSLLEPQVTGGAVHLVEGRALRKLRHPSNSKKIMAVLRSDWPHGPEESKRIIGREKLVEELEVSVRLYNCLKNASMRTLGDVVRRTRHDLMRTKNFGKRSLEELETVLREYKLRLPDPIRSELTLIFIKSTKMCRSCKQSQRAERCVICGRGLCHDCASKHVCPKLELFNKSLHSSGLAFRKVVYNLTVLRRGTYEPYSGH